MQQIRSIKGYLLLMISTNTSRTIHIRVNGTPFESTFGVCRFILLDVEGYSRFLPTILGGSWSFFNDPFMLQCGHFESTCCARSPFLPRSTNSVWTSRVWGIDSSRDNAAIRFMTWKKSVKEGNTSNVNRSARDYEYSWKQIRCQQFLIPISNRKRNEFTPSVAAKWWIYYRKRLVTVTLDNK